MADVAWKLVAANLSDLAAKGAEPLGVLLGYMLGDDDERFLAGLDEVLAHYGVAAARRRHGRRGDGPRTLGLTAIGRATHTPVPSRAGAQIGDALYVTGTLGAAMLGFEALMRTAPAATAAYRRPLPVLAEGRALAPHVTAMMDVSDGLLLDALRMAEASGVTLRHRQRACPVADPEAARWNACAGATITSCSSPLPQAPILPVAATRIGTVEPRGFAPLLLDGEPLTNAQGLGYTPRIAQRMPGQARG